MVQLWEDREERLDRRAAMAPWILASVYRKKGADAPKLKDFMPKKEETPEDIAANQQAIKAAFMALAKNGT